MVTTTSPLASLLRYTQPYRFKMALAAICSILNMCFDILPEILIGIAVNVVVKQEHSLLARIGIVDIKMQLILLGCLTFVVWFFESVFEYCYYILWRNLAQTVQHELRLNAYQHIQQLEMAYHEEVSTGKLLSILNDDINQLERFLDSGINQFIQLFTSTTVILCIFFYFSPMIALFVLIPIPFIILTTRFFQRNLQPRYFEVREKASMIAARLVNNIMGVMTIKSYTAQAYELERVKGESQAYKDANARAIAVSAAFVPVVRLILAMGFIATIILGGLQVFDGTLDIGVYSMLVFQTQRFLWPFTELAEMVDRYERAMASTRRVMELLKIKQTVKITGNKPLDINTVKGHIEFKEVSFFYPNGVHIFDHLNLEIEPGTTVAFVGATGSGKSTLIKLLLRFYDPSSGTILLDGRDIATVNIDDLRKAIGLVSQEVFLFNGTVKENIAYGTFDADDAAIEQAAHIAEAHDFIMQLPEGYNTSIGERGGKLSGGQRQRISIARALLKNSPIFIFDEATSAVDNETEAHIQRSLEKMTQGHTVIVIAHRLSIVRNAHTIFVMDEGMIVERGTHEELVKKNGLYTALWHIQTGEKVGR